MQFRCYNKECTSHFSTNFQRKLFQSLSYTLCDSFRDICQQHLQCVQGLSSIQQAVRLLLVMATCGPRECQGAKPENHFPDAGKCRRTANAGVSARSSVGQPSGAALTHAQHPLRSRFRRGRPIKGRSQAKGCDYLQQHEVRRPDSDSSGPFLWPGRGQTLSQHPAGRRYVGNRNVGRPVRRLRCGPGRGAAPVLRRHLREDAERVALLLLLQAHRGPDRAGQCGAVADRPPGLGQLPGHNVGEDLTDLIRFK